MRFLALACATFLIAAPAAGQTGPPTASSSDTRSSSGGGDQNPATPTTSPAPSPAAQDSSKLPISLDRIRDQLKLAPAPALRGLHEEAMFRVQIQERQKIEELLATLDFKTGPTPAGGLYNYEIQRIIKPPTESPLSQPYAAFSTSELLTIAIENLAVKYLGGRAVNAVTAAERQRAEQAARDEVARSMADFCAAQPNRGAGLQGCQYPPR
jgi:hypothetical protein